MTDSELEEQPENTKRNVRIIFHAGMGKTGTSSIQLFLREHADELLRNGVQYLGMWMDFVDPKYQGWHGHHRVLELNEKEISQLAIGFQNYLAQRSSEEGIHTFLFSNEDFAEHCDLLKPIVEHLDQSGIEVTALFYIRDPMSWLPSAYYQWGLLHKSYSGPAKSYSEFGREALDLYRGPLKWYETFPDKTVVRNYNRSSDIVADFCEFTELPVSPKEIRVNKTSIGDDKILRAFFAAIVDEGYYSSKFETSVGVDAKALPKLTDVAVNAFDTSSTTDIISENAKVFEKYNQIFGFDPREVPEETQPDTPDIESLREQLIDLTAGMTINQSLRIHQLEVEVNILRQELYAVIQRPLRTLLRLRKSRWREIKRSAQRNLRRD